MPRDWAGAVGDMSYVQTLIHLSMRQTADDVERIRGELLRQRRKAYEDELTIQAARVGCPGRRGRLTTGPSLTELNNQSKADAQSITNTYNYDLAMAIQHIASETPTANRHVYAKRLAGWEAKRAAWKKAQIAQYTTGRGRALALSDFQRFNNVEGYAHLEPKEAVCPVCKGWVKRGKVPLQEATNNPPPYHVNCPHYWVTKPGKVPKGECPLLWMGE